MNHPSNRLESVVGRKTAEMLLAYAMGQDTRVLTVIPEVRSVGVQVSYGVRCVSRKDVEVYVSSLCRVS